MKVFVAMSGGVDSSTTAALLKEQGHEVTGVTMLLHDAASDETAKTVARYLKIPHKTIDLKDLFKKEIITYFVDEYNNGRTPNPCVLCNKKIKFGMLLDYALENGADFLATGHYARIELTRLTTHDSRFTLKKGIDGTKDQSYFLWMLDQQQLVHILFPLGAYTKHRVREMARERGLPVADRPESQEICFVPDDDYRALLRKSGKRFIEPGSIISPDGTEIGRHKGIIDYTVGQRKGLGIAAGHPLYVTAIDIQQNAVITGTDEDLYRSEIECDRSNIISGDQLAPESEVTARIRYNSPGSTAIIRPLKNGTILAGFKIPQRAVAPGQSIVFYDDDIVIGGAVIS